jgi:hypothetical protein
MSETGDERERRMMDDGMLWGFMEGETFIALRKAPMVRAGLGPPPFDVTLPDGRVRHVVGIPDGSKP